MDSKALADRLDNLDLQCVCLHPAAPVCPACRAQDIASEAARILRDVVPGLGAAPSPFGESRICDFQQWESCYVAWYYGPRKAALDAMEKDDATD